MWGGIAKPAGVTLIGGGTVTRAALRRAVKRAPRLIAVDGGANRALALGCRPERVIGDLDSLSPHARAMLGRDRLLPVEEQETTDFHKALARVDAPLVMAVGFTGARLDHTLAAMTELARFAPLRVIVDSGAELCLLAPPRLTLDLAAGTRVSLFPLARMRCRSSGLAWPTEGVAFDPLGRVGTSNAARGGPVVIEPESPAMLLMLPVRTLDRVITALAGAPLWPTDARAR